MNSKENLNAAISTTEKERVAIGLRIRQSRLSNNVTRSDLAEAVQVSPQAVQQWEKGKTTPKGNNLRKLAKKLNTSPQYIQFGTTKNELNEPELPELKELAHMMNSKFFSAIYQSSVTHIMTEAIEFGWISVSPKLSPGLLAELGMNHMKWLTTSRKTQNPAALKKPGNKDG